MAAAAAMILIGRLGATDPTLGNIWELDAIAAAVIGGANLMGRRGSIIGTLIRAIILGKLRNRLTLMNVQAFYPLLATGIIIIVAMLIDKLTSGRQGQDMNGARAVGAEIWMRLPSLTPLKGKVAKKLGFAGLRDFRQGLIDHCNSDTAALHSEIGSEDIAGQIVQKVFRTAMQEFEETFAILDLQAIERAADCRQRARKRDGAAADANLSRTMRAVQAKRKL